MSSVRVMVFSSHSISIAPERALGGVAARARQISVVRKPQIQTSGSCPCECQRHRQGHCRCPAHCRACFIGWDNNWCARPDSNRHAFRRGIFVPPRLSSPPACAGVRGLDFALAIANRPALGRRRQVSARSPPERSFAQRCLAVCSRGFADFDAIHAEAFALGCSIISPLRLPISSRAHNIIFAQDKIARRIDLSWRPVLLVQRAGALMHCAPCMRDTRLRLECRMPQPGNAAALQ